MSTVQRTAKIAIVEPLNCDYKTMEKVLRSVQKACLFAANWTITSLVAQDRKAWTCGHFSPEGEFKLPEKSKRKKSKSSKTRWDIPAIEDGEGKDSDYQLLRQRCPHISSNITSAVARNARQQYSTHRFDSFLNRSSPPVFKSFPIPIHNQRWRLETEDKGHVLTVSLLSKDATGFEDSEGKPLRRIRFLLNTWKNRGFEQKALTAIANGLQKQQELKILRNERKKKWIILIPYVREVVGNDLADGRVMNVSPYETDEFLRCVRYITNAAPWIEPIEYGSVEKYQRWYQRRREELGKKYRQDTKHGEGKKVAAVGRGRKRAIKNKVPAATKYRNMTRTFNQQKAAYIARIALRWRCARVEMVDLTKVDKEHLILGDWPYYELQNCIRNACEAQGIEFVLLEDVVEQLKAERELETVA